MAFILYGAKEAGGTSEMHMGLEKQGLEPDRKKKKFLDDRKDRRDLASHLGSQETPFCLLLDRQRRFT